MGNLVFQATLGGQVNLVGPNTASTYNINVPTVNATLATTDANTFTAAQTISSGNLIFSGTGQKVTGDFSNATLTSRAAFQTSTTNGSTGIYALPNGTSTAASWQATNAADPTNASKILIATNGSTDVQLVSGINGTGTYLPLTFYTNGAEKMRLDTSGNLGLGVTPSAWSSGRGVLQLKNNSSLTDASGAGIWGFNWYNDGSGNKYIGSDYASRLIQSGGGFQWAIAPSGTAGNAITFTQAMTLDASGNLGIGLTSPIGTRLSIQANTSGYVGGFVNDATLNYSQMYFYGTTSSAYTYIRADGRSTGYLAFGTNDAERARITSLGTLVMGKTVTSLGTKGLVLIGDQGVVCQTYNGGDYGVLNCLATSGTNYAMAFWQNGNTEVGSIRTTNSATSYVTSSDYRLKENIAPMTGALDVVAQLKPCTYTWKSDGAAGQGFIAHELQEVVPDAVVGEKDGTRIEQYEISPAVPATYDEEGNELTPAVEAVMGEREVPSYQGVDTSFLVATLTAAIQEQQAIITQLQADVAALKG